MRTPLWILGLVMIALTSDANSFHMKGLVHLQHLAPVSPNVVESPPSEAEPLNRQCGIATYYDYGSITASGEPFNPKQLTAAHLSIPFGSWITVVDQDTGLSVKVRINDRGPWVDGHMLDLTPAGIRSIDPTHTSDRRHVCIYWRSTP